MTVQKVDGILHQLEAWLHRSKTGVKADDHQRTATERQRPSTEPQRPSAYQKPVQPAPSLVNRYKLPESYSSPPMEIIDTIDATCV